MLLGHGKFIKCCSERLWSEDFIKREIKGFLETFAYSGFGTFLFILFLYFIFAENGPLGASLPQMTIQCANEITNSVEYIVQWWSINYCSIFTYSLIADILIQQKNILLTFPLISSSLMCPELSCHFGIHFCFSLSDCSEGTSPAGMSGTNSTLETLI